MRFNNGKIFQQDSSSVQYIPDHAAYRFGHGSIRLFPHRLFTTRRNVLDFGGLETLMCSGIAMRSNGGKNIPSGFTQVILGGIYFLFVIVMSVGNALANFSVVKYMLIHIGGLIVFLVPMILINMAALRLSGADRKEREEGRINLSSLSSKVGYIVDDLVAAGISRHDLMQLANLSEAIKFSDPTPASRKLERELEEAVNNLEKAALDKDMNEIARACTLAERALKTRNEAVINAK